MKVKETVTEEGEDIEEIGEGNEDEDEDVSLQGTDYADGLVVLISPIYIADNDRRLVCHICNADRNQTIFPKPILMCTNERQHLEDEKAQNRHFRIGPLPQYARVLRKSTRLSVHVIQVPTT
jgi:hypothetical protein